MTVASPCIFREQLLPLHVSIYAYRTMIALLSYDCNVSMYIYRTSISLVSYDCNVSIYIYREIIALARLYIHL